MVDFLGFINEPPPKKWSLRKLKVELPKDDDSIFWLVKLKAVFFNFYFWPKSWGGGEMMIPKHDSHVFFEKMGDGWVEKNHFLPMFW